MKSNPEWETPPIDFSKFQRQGLYHESQADGFSETQETESLVQPEPMPETSDSPAMWDLAEKALQDILKVVRERDEFGLKKYGTRLKAFNGRRPLVDAFQESLDNTVYLQQEIYERQFIDKVVDAATDFTLNYGENGNSLRVSTLFSAVDSLLKAQGKRK